MQVLETEPRPLCPFGSPATMQTGRGGVIDWDRVSDYYSVGKFTVKLNGAKAIGAVSLTVDALPYKVRKDTVLNFGTVPSVVVTLSGNEAIGQTDLSVSALTGAIPAGTLLYFGAGEQVVRVSTAAAKDDVLLIVDALTIALETGDTATYKGGQKLAKVTEDVEAGETTIPVIALEYAIADNAEAYADKTSNTDGKRIPQGTVMAKTSAGKLIPRREATDEEAFAFLISDANQNSKSESLSGYGTVIGNTDIYENLCPDADATTGDLPADYKTELQANSLGFVFVDWYDSFFD